MGAIAFQVTSLRIVYSTVYSGADQRKHQSSASLAFVRVIHLLVTRKMTSSWISVSFSLNKKSFLEHLGEAYIMDFIFFHESVIS